MTAIAPTAVHDDATIGGDGFLSYKWAGVTEADTMNPVATPRTAKRAWLGASGDFGTTGNGDQAVNVIFSVDGTTDFMEPTTPAGDVLFIGNAIDNGNGEGGATVQGIYQEIPGLAPYIKPWLSAGSPDTSVELDVYIVFQIDQ